MLWAALASKGASPGKVWYKQVSLSLLWLKAFFALEVGPLTCVKYADRPGTFPVIMFDASTTGGGALLWVLPHDRQLTADDIMGIQPWAYIAHCWDSTDMQLASANVLDSAGHARWECYMLLLALHTWSTVVFQSRGVLRIIGDALGVLHSAVRFKSQDPVINVMCMELALLFAPHGSELEAVHLWSENNHLADTLSRLHEGAAVPDVCTKVRRALPRRDGFRVLVPHGDAGYVERGGRTRGARTD
jgi:hypothetical protein